MKALARTVIASLLTLVPNAYAQAPLDLYSNSFSGTATNAPASAWTGASLTVDVAAIEQFEIDTAALRARMDAHMADTGAHQPHGHPHGNHGTDGMPAVYANATDLNEQFTELIALLAALLAREANAQSPPALQLYQDDLDGGSATAPTTLGPSMSMSLDNDIPLIDQIRNLIASLARQITQHVAARPGHAHSHPHTH